MKRIITISLVVALFAGCVRAGNDVTEASFPDVTNHEVGRLHNEGLDYVFTKIREELEATRGNKSAWHENYQSWMAEISALTTVTRAEFDWENLENNVKGIAWSDAVGAATGAVEWAAAGAYVGSKIGGVGAGALKGAEVGAVVKGLTASASEAGNRGYRW